MSACADASMRADLYCQVCNASCSARVCSEAWYASATATNTPETMIASSANKAAVWTLRLDGRDARGLGGVSSSPTPSPIDGGGRGCTVGRGGMVVRGRPCKLGLTLKTNGGMEGGD